MAKVLLYDLGKSISFGRLPLLAKVLWPMLLAASDNQGRGLSEPDVIKWTICPNVEELTPANIPGLLDEMARQEMIHLYTDERGRNLYQVNRWWEYQQPQWAQPSNYPAPPGWTDRVRCQRGTQQIMTNWELPGGFTATAKPAPVPVPADIPGDIPGENPPAFPPGNPPATPKTKTNLTEEEPMINLIQEEEAGVPKVEPQPATPPSEKPTVKAKSPPGNGHGKESPAMAFTALAAAYRMDTALLTERDRGRLNAVVKRLTAAGYTADEIADAGQFWWAEDWRGKKGSPPTDSQFFQVIAQRRAFRQANAPPPVVELPAMGEQG